MSARAHVVLGVTGGIAAYKAVELLRRLTESGHDVTVVPTEAALAFVGAPTWAALSGRPVSSGMWQDVHEVPHVRLGQSADLVLVAPATADLLARAAHGLADDLLTNVLLTARCPVLLAPAMHTEMWEHPATTGNVATLRGRGVQVLEPAVGRLTGADSGKGRLPEPEAIFEAALAALRPAARDLTGRRVVVSAGGTREFLDPVRFLGNRSSGRQGYALARTAAARGAEVVLVSAAGLPDPAGVQVEHVTTAQELQQAMTLASRGCDAIVMAAAVADYRPAERLRTKRKKTAALTVELVQNPDVLAELVAARTGGNWPVIVGFAAETGDADGDALMHGRTKLARKGCDLLVVNEVGEPGHPTGFETDQNAAVVLGADGTVTELALSTKAALADAVWDLVVARLPPQDAPAGR